MNQDRAFLRLVNKNPGISSRQLCLDLNLVHTELTALAKPWLNSGLVVKKKRKGKSPCWYPSVKEQ